MKKHGLFTHIAATIFLILAATVGGCGGDNADGGGGGALSNAVAEKSAPGGDNQQVDACKFVTQDDATKLFGQPASRDTSGAVVVDPNMLGECEWSYDIEATGSQLIQFRIWANEMYYGPTADSQPLDIGDKGAIRVNEFAGVDIEWVQDGKAINLSYFTTGSGVPDATTKVEEVKALARQAAARL